MGKIMLKNLDEALAELDKLAQSQNVKIVNWSVYRILQHCAQTIEYSMTGYPQQKPKLLQWTIGKLAISKFLRQGYMKHNLAAPVPGSPALIAEGTPAEGLELVRNAIVKFKQFDAPFQPHLLFGNLTKSQYDQYFAMHIADHLSELVY